MKDIILEKDNFIIISLNYRKYLLDQYEKGNSTTFQKRFFQKLIFSVKQDSSTSAPEYAENPWFFANS